MATGSESLLIQQPEDVGERIEASVKKPSFKSYGDGVLNEKIYSTSNLPSETINQPIVFSGN